MKSTRCAFVPVPKHRRSAMTRFISLKSLACLLLAGVVSAGMVPSARAEYISDGNLGRFSPTNPRWLRPGCHYDVHYVRLTAGTTYVIDLRSRDFDAYLILADGVGNFLDQDDDSGGNLDARIVFTPSWTGTY